MPDMIGPDLAVEVCAIRGDIPVLYMSGYAGATLVSRLPSGPSVRFVEKPFRVADLLASAQATVDAT